MSPRLLLTRASRMSLLLTALCAITLSAQSEPITVEPLTLEISDPAQTRGLTVVKFELPVETIIDPAAEIICFNAEASDPNIRWLVATPPCLQPQQHAGKPIVWYGLLREPKASDITVTSRDVQQTLNAQWQLRVDPAEARPGSANLLPSWAEARNQWLKGQQYRYFAANGARRAEFDPRFRQNLFAYWQTIAAQAYSVEPPDSRRAGRQARPGETLNAFSLFSGEAAIQETLQQQLLTTGGSKQGALDRHIDTLQGPQAPSHPFAELLAERPGGQLDIAHLVPAERWFVHISTPGKALDWLNTLSDSSAQLAGLSTQSYIDQALVEQYLNKLKLSPEFIQRLGPLAQQAALFGPDLYLQHGSHISLIAEAPGAPALSALLKLLLGIGGDASGVQPYGQGEPAYFAQHEQWLIFSTSQHEAEQVLQLARNQGQGSLGDSVEFRYMLEQLPVTDSGLYVYLSDPFIRAMTGPRIKIAQLRRHQARARLELVTAAALLYQTDYGQSATLDELIASNFVAATWLQSPEGDRLTLDPQGRAQSKLYGSLAAMTPLSDLAIDAISSAEAEGYQTYADNYSRFWRTTFDPIGIRIEIADKIQVETLILPLINNSIYDAVRAMIGGEAAALNLPAMTPAPVTSLGFKLPEPALRELAGDIFRYRYRENIPDMLAGLTGQIHIALYDSEPIIAFGSADLMGAFSGWFMRGLGRRDTELFLYGGMLASLLTQPTAIFIELREGVEVEPWARQLLQALDWDFGERNLQAQGDKAWVYTYSLENIVRFHLYLRQEGDYLIISNRSTPMKPAAGATLAAQANAALSVDFAQIQQLAPVLHLHAMQALPAAWRSAVGQIAPLRRLDTASPVDAQAQYQRLYGYRPELPPNSPWSWPDEIAWQAQGENLLPDFKLPAYHELAPEQRRIGPFQDLDRLQVSFKLVDEGVRVMLELTPKR